MRYSDPSSQGRRREDKGRDEMNGGDKTISKCSFI